MLVIKGTGVKGGEMPVGREEALRYFENLPDFIHKIQDVDTVKPLGQPHTYLVTHKPIGALNFFTTVVYVVRGEFTPDGLKLSSFDFDAEKVKSEHPVLKGFVEGMLSLRELAPDRTHAELSFTLRVEFPLTGPLKLAPRQLVQTTADGLMTLKTSSSVNDLYAKVLADFNLPG